MYMQRDFGTSLVFIVMLRRTICYFRCPLETVDSNFYGIGCGWRTVIAISLY